jgi:hypothetical protein
MFSFIKILWCIYNELITSLDFKVNKAQKKEDNNVSEEIHPLLTPNIM